MSCITAEIHHVSLSLSLCQPFVFEIHCQAHTGDIFDLVMVLEDQVRARPKDINHPLGTMNSLTKFHEPLHNTDNLLWLKLVDEWTDRSTDITWCAPLLAGWKGQLVAKPLSSCSNWKVPLVVVVVVVFVTFWHVNETNSCAFIVLNKQRTASLWLLWQQ